MSISSCGLNLRREDVVEIVLQKHRDHRVRRDPAVVRRQSHPQPCNALSRNALPEAVDEPGVWQSPVGAYIITLVPFFCFIILVLTLSKGSEKQAVAIPEIADAISLIDMVSVFYPVLLMMDSFAWLQATKCEQLSTLALAIVGIAPVHSPLTPSSLAMVARASKTFLQFLLSALGRLLSDWNRISETSVGLAIAEPIPPAVREQATFYPKLMFLPPLARFERSSSDLQRPSRIPQQINCLRMAESSPLQSPTTPSSATMLLATTKGLVTAAPLPAASLLPWMTTLTVSMGWMTAEAILPEREPMMKGAPYCSKKEVMICKALQIPYANQHSRYDLFKINPCRNTRPPPPKYYMAETQTAKQLAFKVTSLQHQLAKRDKELQQYQAIESEADAKISALNKMHSDKVRNLLNSIQILKKEKASIEGLSKEHKRSKLIEQLNKQILDQDLAIEVLRKVIYDKEGKEKGRQICDEVIVKALTKGPERIRPLSREELRMEIDKLKSVNISLENKLKGGKGQGNPNNKNGNGDDISEISDVSENSFINQNEELLKKLRSLQFENENVKMEVNAKMQFIEKLKNDLKEQENIKMQMEMYKNQMEVANRKVSTYERLMKESKENTNAKIIELYEREIKVEELEMISNENRDKLKSAQEGHNILIDEMRLEKEQLQAEMEAAKSENEQLIMENIAGKKRLDELKKIIKDMDDLNGKQKEDLKAKLATSQIEIQRIVADNRKYNDAYRNIEGILFTERAQWVDEKAKLLEELNGVRENAASKELIGKYMQDISDLREENERLKKLLESGGSGGDDKMLLERLDNYKRKLQFYESKGDKAAEKSYYDELFKKYNDLMEEFEQYKLKYGPKEQDKKLKRKNYIEMNQKEASVYENMSSGISRLGLEEVDSDALEGFDSSYEYEIVINEHGERVRMPKISQADRELLALITSDLWEFVTDDRMEKKIHEAASFYDDSDLDDEVKVDYDKIRRIKNLNDPRGKKITMYEEEINQMNSISDSVSVTSALDKQLNQYDSDVNIEMKRMPKGAAKRPLNSYALPDVSLSVDGLSDISSAKSGESNLVVRKKKVGEKASRLEVRRKEKEDLSGSDFDKSSIGSSLLDSDVSSVGFKEEELALVDSDVEPNFRKNKKA